MCPMIREVGLEPTTSYLDLIDNVTVDIIIQNAFSSQLSYSLQIECGGFEPPTTAPMASKMYCCPNHYS